MAFKHPHPLAGTTWNVTRVKITTSLGVYLPLIAILVELFLQVPLLKIALLFVMIPFAVLDMALPYPFSRILAPDIADTLDEEYRELRYRAYAYGFGRLIMFVMIVAASASLSRHLGFTIQASLTDITTTIIVVAFVWRSALPFHYIAFNVTPPVPST